MNENAGLGMLLVLLGGLVHGSWALPMKRIKNWQWENYWLVYSVFGLIVLPMALAAASVPRLLEAYQRVSWGTLLAVALCGLGWGIGSILFGLGISRLGMALGFAIILGITSSVGSLLPLVTQNPGELFTRRGYILMAGLLLVIVGIWFCSVAGGLREREQRGGDAGAAGRNIVLGLVICVASGLLSPMLNVGFVYGQKIEQEAVAMGGHPVFAANATWALALLAGFLANAGYCLYLLQKNRTWGLFTGAQAPVGYWLGGALMGLLWFGGITTYGMGAANLGKQLGPVLGWPVFMAMVIVTANVWGFITGEWKGASRKASGYSVAGIAILVAAIAVISRGR